MRLRLIVVVVLVTLNIACTLWGKPANGWRGATGGEQIEKLFWDDVRAKNWTEVDHRVAGAFYGTSPAGIVNRAAFLNELQRAPLTDFSLSECEAHLNGNDMVIACKMRATWGGQTRTTSTLSVWQELKKGWVMIAHSDSILAGS